MNVLNKFVRVYTVHHFHFHFIVPTGALLSAVTQVPTTEQHDTTNGYQNRNVHTMRQVPGPDYTQPQCTQL
jgi:hypothetical protein